jgi:hypothetical protein
MQQHQQAEQQTRQAYAAAAQQQFQEYGRRSDDAFDAYARTQVSAEQMREIKQEASNMLRDYGASEQEIVWNWQNNAAFRSVAAQKMMFDAARWRLSQRSIKSKVFAPVPTVQAPSSPAARGSEQDYSMRQLEKRLSETGSAKDAAALLLDVEPGDDHV